MKNFCSKCKKFNLRKKSLEQIPFFEQCYRHPFIFMFCLVTPRAWCRGYIGKFWYCAAGDHDFLYVFICLCMKLYFFIKMFSISGDWSKYDTSHRKSEISGKSSLYIRIKSPLPHNFKAWKRRYIKISLSCKC